MPSPAFALLAALAFAPSAHGLIHSLVIENDSRSRFFIESFGFEQDGHLELEVTNFKIDGKAYNPAPGNREVGFLIKRTSVDPSAFLEENAKKPCLLDDVDEEEDNVVEIKVSKRTRKDIVVRAGQEGFYNAYFISCVPAESVSFNLNFTQYNVGIDGSRNYLSAGLQPLPSMYGAFAAGYIFLLIIWWYHYVRPGVMDDAGQKKAVNTVHYLMTLLLALKMLALVFKAIEYSVQASSGTPGGWGVVYWCLNGVKGGLMFVLIVMIGSGWKFVKPFLSEKDKKIFLMIIPLQVIDNIALFIVEETAPGSQGFFTMKDTFRLIDILCCGAILIPIIWSIKHLREASSIDGKAARNLEKLKLFRQFYLMVVSYIYFTRIIVYLLDATLPFRHVWLGDFFTEIATVAFFTATGWLFKPVADNAFFKLNDSDDEGEMAEVRAEEGASGPAKTAAGTGHGRKAQGDD